MTAAQHLDQIKQAADRGHYNKAARLLACLVSAGLAGEVTMTPAEADATADFCGTTCARGWRPSAAAVSVAATPTASRSTNSLRPSA